MTSLRERHHQATLTTIAKQVEKRDAILAQLCRVQDRLTWLFRAKDRYERARAKEAAIAVNLVEGGKTLVEAGRQAAAIAAKEETTVFANLDIPDELLVERKRAGEMRDKVAADAIRAEQEERKRNKTRVRIEEMKAKQAGKTKQMPLQGKAALDLINQK